MHVVQVGYDDSVFVAEAPSDTRARQRLYGELLVAKRPGSRMTVLAFSGSPTHRPLRDGPVTFIPVAGHRGLQHLRLLRRLVSLNRECHVDVIATQTIFADAAMALLFARFTRARVIGQIHFDVFSPFARAELLGGRCRARWRMAVALRLLRHLDVVRVTATRLRTELLARNLHSNVVVVPMVASLPLGPGTPGSDGPGRVLFVGRLVPQKDLRRWLRVATRIHHEEPEVEFQWAGDGPLRAELLAEAESLGLGKSLRWLGPVPYGQLPSVYGAASVFLLTSNYEGLPRVIMEAGAQAVPVVSTRVMGVEDIVLDRETGFLHELDDEAGLASSVLRLLRDAGLRARMGRAAQDRVRQKFDLPTWAEGWVDLMIGAAGSRM